LIVACNIFIQLQLNFFCISVMAFRLKSYIQFALIISVILSSLHYYLKVKEYRFSPRFIRSMGEKYAGRSPSVYVKSIMTDLRASTAGPIIPAESLGVLDMLKGRTAVNRQKKLSNEKSTVWLSVNFGGIQGRIHFFHLSWSEYLALVGVPMKSIGSSSLHWMNQSCTVLSGSLQRHRTEESFVHEHFEPGKHVRFGVFENYIVEISEDTWLLCYGRGLTMASFLYCFLGWISQADFFSPILMLSIALYSLLVDIADYSLQFYHRFFR
ncbi:Sigma non-opioid intracellular receptor 1, partial [Trichinella sp. T9]